MHMEGDVSRGIELHAHGRRRVKRDRATCTWKETCQEGESYMHMEGDVSRGIELHAHGRRRVKRDRATCTWKETCQEG